MIKKYYYKIFEESGIVKAPVRITITICVLLILLAESCFLYYHSPKENEWLICIVYKLTGYYCPGCGAGRASYSILHGELYQAFRYNPLMIILLPWMGLYLGICAVQWLVKGYESLSQHIPIWITYIIMAIVILYGILRNLDTYPFVLLAPTRVI